MSDTIEKQLQELRELRAMSFIDDETKTKEIGFIAQDVQEVVPELVTYAEDIDQYGVKYGNVTALLVEAIKEQQKSIEKLNAKIEFLENSLGGNTSNVSSLDE